jgi:hypothetical protein
MNTAVADKAGGKPADERGDPRITLTVIYNGQGLSFQENPNEPGRTPFKKALAQFHLHPDSANLFLRYGSTELPLDAKLKDSGVPDGAELYLEARRVGGGTAGAW